MNYDRLLQLGGIDREVPPIPGYISKEELKEWQDNQEKEIPDGVIKGVKEIEDFLAIAPDSENIYQYSQALLATTINTMEMDEESGDITISYDDGLIGNND